MIFKNFTLLWRRFTPAEERILDCVRTTLTPDALDIFEQQVRATTSAQRYLDWNEVIFYRKINNIVNWSGIPSFPRTDEFRLATVGFSIAQRPFEASLHCVNGHIFSIHFSPGSKQVAFDEWDGKPSVKLAENPMTTAVSSEQVPTSWANFLHANQDRVFLEWEIYSAQNSAPNHSSRSRILTFGRGPK